MQFYVEIIQQYNLQQEPQYTMAIRDTKLDRFMAKNSKEIVFYQSLSKFIILENKEQ